MRNQSTTSRDCEWCGRAFLPKTKVVRFCSRKCFHTRQGMRQRGENHPTWKGRVETHTGYIRLWRPGHPLAHKDGYVLEHRLVLYEAGVEISDSAHVHHANGNKRDNRLENLSVHPAGEHHRNHIREEGYVTNQYGRWPLLTSQQREKKRHSGSRARYVT